ncbi:NAD-dependent epimerase/dehydratase family protein [Kiloniella laminariae]|uniref:NAD-dependent epimerase/dehydratase family protein n=1 Tax=Kiloniella laminariae TaxID=454162 RepID=UPI000362DD94|nr:SDR family oxidoreductase [Kiloniella laminariae]
MSYRKIGYLCHEIVTEITCNVPKDEMNMISELPTHVLVTGGAGYVGSALVPALLADGYNVTVYDICFFGDDHLPKDDPRLQIIRGDIRDTESLAEAFLGIDTVIHLACISNDASFELDEKLSTSVNLTCFEPMVKAAKRAGVQRFIYASSASVYGVSNVPDITEEHPLKPVTLYNEFKGLCEPILLRYHDDDFCCIIVRPSTVCGYAPRQRLDLSVNILTNHAVTNSVIRVFGGSQRRPNLHIKDMVRLYRMMLTADSAKVGGEVFNVGCENASILSIAKVVRAVVSSEYPGKKSIDLVVEPSDDIRSYHVNSEKISRILGFVPEYGIRDAVQDLCSAFSLGNLPNSMANKNYYNVQRMKELNVQ